jgi:hypothetical protein
MHHSYFISSGDAGRSLVETRPLLPIDPWDRDGSLPSILGIVMARPTSWYVQPLAMPTFRPKPEQPGTAPIARGVNMAKLGRLPGNHGCSKVTYF